MHDYKFIILILSIIKSYQCNEYLLPDTVTPKTYDLRILTTLHECGPNDFTFKGQVKIGVICNKKSNKITLHSHELGINNIISVKNIKSKKCTKVTKFDLEPKYDFLHLHLKDPIEVHEKYIIKIQFHGNLTTSMFGYYRSSYKNHENNQTSWLAVTQFEPTNARRAFPCFDEPALRAVFKITLKHNKNLFALSNMPLNSTKQIKTNIVDEIFRKNNKNYVIDKFQETVVMSTYLVAYMLSDFGHVNSPPELSNTTFKIWARNNALSQACFARITGPRGLCFLENYFKIPYPLPKLDMVAIPDFNAGAMENWGLITYRETALLYDDRISTQSNKERVAEVICHELAHMWFGNLVTLRWWNELWLKEGFATYMSVKCVDRLFPAWNYEISRNMLYMKLVFDEDSLVSSVPLSMEVNNPNEIGEMFGVIAYKKGSAMLRMIEKFLEEDVLRAGLTNYLKEHRCRSATQDDLWNALTAEAHKVESFPKSLTINKIMDTWTLQTGYPVVNVKRNYKTGLVEITQERFVEKTNVSCGSNQDNCWRIPFSYTTEDIKDFNGTKPKMWLPCPRTTCTFVYKQPKMWIIGNIQRSGLYRISYDIKNWKRIITHLKCKNLDEISEQNRVAFIDDIMALADLGKVNFSLAFDLLKYLQREEKPTPWNVALQCLKKINRIFAGGTHRDIMKPYMQRMLEPMYKKYGGFHTVDNEPTNFQKLIVVQACANNVELCENDAMKLFQEYVKCPQKFLIHKEFRPTVFCTGIRNGGQKEWDYFWKKYLNSNIGTEQVLFLQSLACSKNKEILKTYIHFILEDNPNAVRKQDAYIVFSAIARNTYGYQIAKSFLYENGPAITAQIKSKLLGFYIQSIADLIAQNDEYEKIKKFILDNPDFRKYANLGVNQAMETIELNIQRRNKHCKEIVAEIK